MARISDELRQFIDEEELLPSQVDELRCIADRIDREMVELPKDADGVPIHVGDTVWNDGGYKLRVVSITSYGDTYRVHAVCPGCDSFVGPEDLTRNRPDSFERIADELEAWCDRVDVDGDACEKPRDIVERIRKLAAKEQGNE